MGVVGLIPARGGSKGIPGKNLVPLAGRPLIAWTIDAALASRELTSVVVSTDDAAIAAAARELGADTLERPARLATDDTAILDVVLHALSCLEPCEAVVVLQPTSPLRRAEHVDEAVRLLRESGADAVVGVVAVPHRYEPGSLMRLEDGRLVPVELGGRIRRQDKPRLYARNGPAVLALRATGLHERGGPYGGDVRPYPMDARSSLDVDDPIDLEIAECLLSRTPEPSHRQRSSFGA